MKGFIKCPCQKALQSTA